MRDGSGEAWWDIAVMRTTDDKRKEGELRAGRKIVHTAETRRTG